MQEAFEKLIFDSSQNVFDDIVAKYGESAYDEGATFKMLKEHRDEIVDEYFPYLKEWINNPDFYKLFDIKNEEHFTALLTCYYIYDDVFLVNYLKNRTDFDDIVENEFFISSLDSYNVLKSHGYSDEAIAEMYIYDSDVVDMIYENNPELVDALLEHSISASNNVMAKIYAQGDHSVVKKISSYQKNEFLKFLISLSNYEVEFKDIFEDIISFMGEDEYSFVKDNEVAKNIVNNWGDLAIVLIDNPSQEIVDLLTDFSLSDYIQYDGKYKDSSALLMRFLNKNQIGALYHANSNAISDEVIEFIKSHDISLSDIVDSNELTSNFKINQLLIENGIYRGLRNLSDIDTAEKVEYLFNLYANEGVEISSFSHLEPINRLIYGLAKNSFNDKISFRNVEFNQDVVNCLIDHGFNIDIYVKYCYIDEPYTKAFFNKGFKEALYVSQSSKFIEENYRDEMYNDFLDFIKKFGKDFTLSNDFVALLIKAGHYDFLEFANFYDGSITMEDLGMEDITYEEYLSLPIKVQQISCLRNKFMEYNSEFIMDSLVNKNDYKAISLALKAGIPIGKVWEEAQRIRSIPPEAVLIFIQNGYYGAVSLISVGSKDDKDLLREIVETYYNKTDGRIIPIPRFADEFRDVVIEFYVEKGRYEILFEVESLGKECVERLVTLGISVDTLIEYNVLNGALFASVLNESNEDKIFEYLMNLTDDYRFYGIEDIVIKYIDSNLNREHLKALTSIFSVSFDYLSRHYGGREEEILQYVNRLPLYTKSPLMLDKLLSILSPEEIAKDLASRSYNAIPSKERILIIRKMVMRGHYDFVKYYNSEIDDEILKRAIMSGYLPTSTLGLNDVYRRHLYNLTFTPEELDYLRSKVVEFPLLSIFLPEILNDSDKLADAIIREPGIVPLLNVPLKGNIPLLKKVVVARPEIVVEYLDSNDVELINELLKINGALLYHLNRLSIMGKFKFNDELIELACEHQPNIIDVSRFVDQKVILKALTNNYKFNNKTSLSVLQVAFNNRIRIPKEFFAQHMDMFFSLVINLRNSTVFPPEELNAYFDPLFSYLLNVNEGEFIYQGSKAAFENPSQEDSWVSELFNKYNLINNNYYRELFAYKDTFLLYKYIIDNGVSIEDIDSLEEKLDDATDPFELFKMILKVFSSYSSDEKYVNFQHRVAKKHFLESPLDYSYFVDVNDPEIIEMAKEHFRIYPDLYKTIPTILKDRSIIISLYEMGKDVYSSLDTEMRSDIEIMVMFLELNPENIIYVDKDNKKVKKYLLANFDKYPFIFKAFPEILLDKEKAIKCISYGTGEAFYYLSAEFKMDYDICLAYIRNNPNHLMYISRDIPRFGELFFEAIKLQPNVILCEYALRDFITQEMFDFVVDKVPQVYGYLPEHLQTLENYAKVPDKKAINYSLISLETLEKIINSDLIDFSDLDLCTNILMVVVDNMGFFKDKMSQNVIKLFSSSSIDFQNDVEVFRALLSLGSEFDFTVFGSENAIVFKNGLDILNATGKVNTISKNPIFNFEVCQHIYPLFGMDFTLDIIKYNTPAANNIIQEIKAGNGALLLEYYDFIKKTNLFENDDRLVHFAFRDFPIVKQLVSEMMTHKNELTNEDIKAFGNILANDNYYKINTFEDLKNYKQIVVKKAQEMLESDDIGAIKNYICQLLGFSLTSLTRDFRAFQLDNFEKFSYIRREFIQKLGLEKGQELWRKMFYTKEDVSIVLFLQRIIESNNLGEIKDLLKVHLNDKNKGIDFATDFMRIIDKVRDIYNLEFNLNLSKPEQLTSSRVDKSDPKNPYGVTIIEMNGEEFNFLAHRLYNYDASMGNFSRMLMDDPSLWTRLEGASTLSTSSFSDKGFWFLEADDPDGVIYLFSELPENFMLFMYGRDLFVEHGGYRLEPTCNNNSFSDINALNQSSAYHRGSYNEVAGYRAGMIPSAIACTSDVPSEAQIRAAKFFSQLTGRDVPIIKFDMKAYEKKKHEALEANRKLYEETFDISLISKIIMNGCDKSVDDLITNVNICFDIMKNKYQNGEIDLLALLSHLAELSSTVNRLDNSKTEIMKASRRIAIYRNSIIALAKLTPDQIIRLENAGLGESGIMYRYEDENGQYLMKPAVEKQSFEKQPFRAEIQAAASRLQQVISPETAVSVQAIESNGVNLSKQELLALDPERKDLLEKWASNGGELDDDVKRALMQEYVVDFLLCNFDCFAGNFVIDKDGKVRGIDKEQSFRFIDDKQSLNPDFSYTPNGLARIPIYQLMFRRYKSNQLSLDLSVILETIKRVKEIPLEQYREMFKKYAYMLKGKEAEAFLDKICERRELAIKKVEEFVKELDPDLKQGVEL